MKTIPRALIVLMAAALAYPACAESVTTLLAVAAADGSALGGPMIDPKHCSRFSGQKDQCVHTDNCSIHDVLGGLAGYVQMFLSRTTLRDLIAADTGGLLVRTGGHVEISAIALEQELGSQDGQTVLE